MSSPLAISGVTAVLQYFLTNRVFSGVNDLFSNNVTVSCVAPDQVDAIANGNEGAENQVNLFMHQVTHNAAWRNMDLPSVGADGVTRLTNQALALDLHYLLTVYGSEEWQAEALLGYALMMLHETPVISRADITTALNALPSQFPLNKMAAPLGASGLADQIEMIKITPATMGREELAWLWTALKVDYRPTYPFQVSVVLMQPPTSMSLARPVLQRNIGPVSTDPTRTGPQPIIVGQLLQVMSTSGQSPQANEKVTVAGVNLGSTNQLMLINQRLGIAWPVPQSLLMVTSTSITFAVPDDAVNLPAGVYDLAAQFADATGSVLQATNSLPFAVAPILPPQHAVTTVAMVGGVDGSLVSVNFTPQARPGQSVSLYLEILGAQASPFATSTGTLNFQFPSVLPAGAMFARLVVDGVVSQTLVNTLVDPPVFTGPMVTV